MLQAAVDGELKALLLVGADPAADVPNTALAQEALSSVEFLVSIDCFVTESNKHADIILPALGFAEKEGTVTNLDGRVMKANKVVEGPGQARADWAVLDDLSSMMGAPMALTSASVIADEISKTAPAYEGISWFLLDWKERSGVQAPRDGASQPLAYIPVGTTSDTGVSDGFVVHSARKLYDNGVLAQAGPSLAGLVDPAFVGLNPADAERIGANGSVNVEGEDVVLVRDQSIPVGTVFVPFNQPGGPAVGASVLVTASAGGTE